MRLQMQKYQTLRVVFIHTRGAIFLKNGCFETMVSAIKHPF
jgi:hypothetical protein